MLDDAYIALFKKDIDAWNFFESLTPYVKKKSVGWVISAKKEETGQRRLKQLMDCSSKLQKIPQMEWKKKKT